MSSHQDSPKVPEKWPPLEMVRDDVDGSISILDREEATRDYPDWEKDSDYEVVTYIPISALLSDEAIEGYARQVWGWNKGVSPPLTDDEKDVARAALQAAIEQVGGGQGGE